jgi:hypothetical protein
VRRVLNLSMVPALDGLGTAQQYPDKLAGHNGSMGGGGGGLRGCPTHHAHVQGDKVEGQRCFHICH